MSVGRQQVDFAQLGEPVTLNLATEAGVILAQTEPYTTRLSAVHGDAKADVFRCRLREPGLLPIDKNLFAYWCCAEHDGERFNVFARFEDRGSVSAANFAVRSTHPLERYLPQYLWLNEDGEEYWGARLKKSGERPLSEDELRRLGHLPSQRNHQLYLDRVWQPLYAILIQTESIIDEFRRGANHLLLDNSFEELADFSHGRLTEIAIFHDIVRQWRNSARKVVVEWMHREEVTAFPLGEGACLVEFQKADCSLYAEVLSVPATLRDDFVGEVRQRGLLTQEQLEELYREIVGPEVEIFR